MLPKDNSHASRFTVEHHKLHLTITKSLLGYKSYRDLIPACPVLWITRQGQMSWSCSIPSLSTTNKGMNPIILKLFFWKMQLTTAMHISGYQCQHWSLNNKEAFFIFFLYDLKKKKENSLSKDNVTWGNDSEDFYTYCDPVP